MVALDCDTRDSTLRSLSGIYAVPEEEVTAFLAATDLEKHYTETYPPHTAEIELRLLFERELGRVPVKIDTVYWFHLTRAPTDSGFSRGILPLNEALPDIWDTIIRIFQGTDHEAALRRMREDGVPDFQYRHKVGKPALAGPYAMLVKETAFRADEIRNHDYLWFPEIVEDICNGYREKTGAVIYEDVRSALVPHVIKFWSQKNRSDQTCIESGLYYLYCMTHGRELSINANTCFDGSNCTILYEQIVKVEKGNGLHAKSF